MSKFRELNEWDPRRRGVTFATGGPSAQGRPPVATASQRRASSRRRDSRGDADPDGNGDAPKRCVDSGARAPPTLFIERDALGCSHRSDDVRDGEVDRAGAAADFDQDLRLVHLAQRHARGFPRFEMFADRDLPALASGLANTVELRPARGSRALRAARASRWAGEERVLAAVDVSGALVRRAARVDRHLVVRVVDDVPLDAW